MRECFQMLLCYWRWLKKKEYWKCHDRVTMVAATNAIRQMVLKIITLWPRSTRQGWNLAKFQEQLHVPDDIMQNGSPKGSHSGPVVYNHIEMVKCPSKYSKSLIFSTTWKQAYVYSTRTQKRPYICHVDVESIVQPILMIP